MLISSPIPYVPSAFVDVTLLIVGTVVSMVKLSELVVPAPAFPAASTTPVLSNTITFVASSTDDDGVKVAV